MWGDRRGGMGIVALIAATVVLFIGVSRGALMQMAERQRPLLVGGEAPHQAECRAQGVHMGIDRNITTHVLSWEPRVLLVKGFATLDETEVFKSTAEPMMKKSGLVKPEGKKVPKRSFDGGIRTSRGAFVTPKHDPTGTIGRVERRLAALTGTPPDMGARWNVLHYPLDAHYAHHYDYFNEDKNPSLAKNQRFGTFLLYVRSPEEGGQTIFPRCINGKNYYRFYEENRIDINSCKRGLLVKPEAGDGILFYSQTPDYTLDPNSLHGGCPVSKGEKWVATKWMHNAKVDQSWQTYLRNTFRLRRDQSCREVNFDLDVGKVKHRPPTW